MIQDTPTWAAPNPPPGTTIRLLRRREVVARVGLSYQWLWKLAKKDQFPRPIKIGEHSCAFEEWRVTAWINEKINAAGKVNVAVSPHKYKKANASPQEVKPKQQRVLLEI